MNDKKPIAVHHVQAGGRVIAVELFLNEGGSVAARCLLGAADMPIIDGATEDEVMAAVKDSLDGLLFARAASG